MAANAKHPLIFPLSSRQPEVSALEAYTWTQGRALVATERPSETVTLANGVQLTPGQCTTTYLFPGIGLGFLISRRVWGAWGCGVWGSAGFLFWGGRLLCRNPPFQTPKPLSPPQTPSNPLNAAPPSCGTSS